MESIKMKSETNFQRNAVLLLLLLLTPIFSIVAQNQQAIKTQLQEDKIYYTPQLTGSSPTIKPATVNTAIQIIGERSSAAFQVQQKKKSSAPLAWPQLLKQMSTSKNMLTEATVYTGTGDQRTPQIVTANNEMFVAFESDDTQGGSYLFGTIDVYRSIDGGATWTYFNGLKNDFYQLLSPQILLVGSDVIVSYISNGALWTSRWGRSDASFISTPIPIPTLSVDEFVVDHRIVTDAEQFAGSNIYFYMAFLFRQTDGKNRVMFSISKDTSRSWEPYVLLGLSQPELKATSIGLDYSSSGLYLAYLVTDTSAGRVLMRKSTSLGVT